MKRKKKKDIRAVLLSLIPPNVTSVLDVGCGSGALGKNLKKRGIKVTGLDNLPELINTAVKVLDNAYVCNIEDDELSFLGDRFDCILCADIIEHLREPETVVRKLKNVLTDGGIFVVSMPNVRYYKVWKQVLFGGTWDYAPTGILDDSHVRFYTKTNMCELFDLCGLAVDREEKNIRASRMLSIFNILTFRIFEDLFVYQYFFSLRQSPAEYQIKKKRLRSPI